MNEVKNVLILIICLYFYGRIFFKGQHNNDYLTQREVKVTKRKQCWNRTQKTWVSPASIPLPALMT